MKQTTIVAVVLGLLVVLSAFQAYQLTTLKSKVANEGLNLKVSGSSLSTGSSSTKVASGSGQPGALPSSIKNLPQMVGGC